MLGINFIGLSYLLVYVGAVSILFLFILMLINVRISELVSDTSNSIPLAIIIGILFNYVVYEILPYSIVAFNSYTVNLNNSLKDLLSNSYSSDYIKKVFNFANDSSDIAFVTSKIWDGNLAETSHITNIGNIMYTSYSIWLIITSVILLLAMIGAIVITIKQKKDDTYKKDSEYLIDKNIKDVTLNSHNKSIKSILFNKRSFHTKSSCRNSLDTSSDSGNDITISDKKWWLVLDKPMQNSQNIATKHIRSGEAITANIINRILSIYNLHVTDEALKALVNTPKLKFNNLNKSLYKDSSFIEKLGKMNGKEVAGVYIFTHKETGDKYVGSSVQLATRLQRYLSGTYKEYGKFLPLLSKEGLDKFSLEVMPIYSVMVLKPELILEQYYLLDPSFNLNVSRVANVPGFKSKEIFMYNKDKTTLIYHSDSIKDFYVKFGIWHAVIVNNIETGSYYLGKYVFSSVPILTAEEGKYSEEEVKGMLTEDRLVTTLFMYNKDKSILYFSGLKSEFAQLGIHTWNLNVSKYINTGSLYLDKYILTTAEVLTANPSGMSVSEIMEMLNKDKENLNVISGKGKKVVLLDVKDNKTLSFKSLSACAEYFRGLGLKTTGNTLKSRLDSGIEYNGYIVKWDEDQTSVHNRAKYISITNQETGLTHTYSSLRDAERNTKIWRETIKKYANTNEPYNGLIISFVE